MFENRAAHSRAVTRCGQLGSIARAFPLMLILALVTLVAAQPAPTISLGAYSYIVGETLVLTATNLEPAAGYRVELTPPAAAGEDRAALVSVLTATPEGTLRYTSPLQYGGTHRVQVTGPRLDATLNVQVSGAESAVGQAPPAGQGQQSQQNQQGQQSQQSQQTQPGQQQPGQTQPEPQPGTQPESQTDTSQPDTSQPDAAQPEQSEQSEQPGASQEEEATEPGAADDAEPGTGTTLPGQQQGPSQTQPQVQPTPQVEPSTPGGTTPGTGSLPQTGQLLPAGVEYRLVGDSVVAESATGGVLWRLDFPVGSGATAGLAQSATRLVVGHGNHLLELSGSTGQVLARHRLPAQVTDAVIVGNSVEATVQYSDGATRRVQVTAGGPTEALPFDADPALYGWLRQEASGADPAGRLTQDPTNPWLYVAQVQSASAGATPQAESLLRSALANSATFYERAQLADAFLALPTPRRELADEAMAAAMEDFVARGYRAELLTDPSLQDAYGFPHGRLLNALGRGDLQRAGFWADWLYRTSTPEVAETQLALREYALYLQEAGQRDEASLWRTRANEARGGFQVGAILTQSARTVGQTGWYGVAALIVSIIALHITLLAKYWRPQSLTMQRARAAGKSVSPLFARLTFMRYATWVEKLVVVLLFAAALALTALLGWSSQLDNMPRAWGSGSLGTPAALDAVATLDANRPGSTFVRGFAAQSVGDEAAAEQAYRQLPDDPAALNNLGVLTGDEAYFRQALDRDPGNATALFNLGTGPNPSNLHAEFGADEPLVVAPNAAILGGALAGTFLGAWQSAFTNPWAALTGLEGVTLAPWLWTVLVVLFLAWAAVSILYLVVPRPRLARNAPRTLLYHMLAILLPGTGLADEFWGVFLMVPWAIFGVDFLLHYIPGGPDPTMALRTDGIALIVIYVLNLVAFFVEFGSYRRRMVALKQNDPQTAREFGMRVPAPELG